MIATIDSVLDRITMYRLVLYVLIGLLGIATILAFLNRLPFPPLALLVSTAVLLVLCWATNTLFAAVFHVASNVESSTITALILALIIDPVQSSNSFQFLGWVAILAMASKYLIAWRSKHLFNPAAIAAVITAFTIGQAASWWVGTTSMLPCVLIGGWLVARKIRQEEMVWLCCATALVGSCAVALAEGKIIPPVFNQVLLLSPLFFFASIMLTEPLTAPPTRKWRRLYAVLTGILFTPQIHIGGIYSTPELALVVGNVFSYIVSPKQKISLKLNRKRNVAPNIVDFLFTPSQPLQFLPGQYMEFTLGHPHVDSRGNRRYFTLASSPTERTVRLGVRFYEQSSSFKKAMAVMTGRTPFVAGQLAGDFTLPPDPSQKLAFIAGGIGITPFRSMLKYLLDTHQRRNIAVFYVNRNVQEIVYTDVLDAAQTKLGIPTWYTLTNTAAIPPNWNGLVGKLDAQMLLATVPDYRERTFYLSGPPQMVRASEQLLKNMGLPAS